MVDGVGFGIGGEGRRPRSSGGHHVVFCVRRKGRKEGRKRSAGGRVRRREKGKKEYEREAFSSIRLCLSLFLTQNQINPARIKRPPTPPTTPPAIAPAWFEPPAKFEFPELDDPEPVPVEFEFAEAVAKTVWTPPETVRVA